MLIGVLVTPFWFFSIKLIVRRPSGRRLGTDLPQDRSSFFPIWSCCPGDGVRYPGYLSWSWLVGGDFAGVGTVVMLARVAKGVHYLTDVLAGAL